ncbi:MAG: hypothetical protein LCI00_30135 [Chloroflexi bacterium]|nr:hypothetical protein [Chloroflexota bacterium]MCC6892826.1 hypothetical protein [Anaerolineae bacterium]
MKHLIPVIFISLTVSILLCLISISDRLDAHTDSLSYLGISQCSIMLCIMDIQSSVTSWDEAKEILISKHAQLDSTYDEISMYYETFRVYFLPDRERKTYIQVRSNDNSYLVSLGDLILEFNTPCMMTVADDMAYLEYPQFIAGIVIPDTKNTTERTLLTPVSKITKLWLKNPQNSCLTPLAFESSYNIFVHWCGFVSIERYIRRCSIRLP